MKTMFVIMAIAVLLCCATGTFGQQGAYSSDSRRIPTWSHYYTRSRLTGPQTYSVIPPYRNRYPSREPAGRMYHGNRYDQPSLSYPTRHDPWNQPQRDVYEDRINGYNGRSRYYQQPTPSGLRYRGSGQRSPVNGISYIDPSVWAGMQFEVERNQVRQAIQKKMYQMKRQIEYCEDDLANCAFNAEELVDKIYEYEKIKGRLPQQMVPENEDMDEMTLGGPTEMEKQGSGSDDSLDSRLCISFCARNRFTNKYFIGCRSYLYNLNLKTPVERKKMMTKCYNCRRQCPEDY